MAQKHSLLRVKFLSHINLKLHNLVTYICTHCPISESFQA